MWYAPLTVTQCDHKCYDVIKTISRKILSFILNVSSILKELNGPEKQTNVMKRSCMKFVPCKSSALNKSCVGFFPWLPPQSSEINWKIKLHQYSSMNMSMASSRKCCLFKDLKTNQIIRSHKKYLIRTYQDFQFVIR